MFREFLCQICHFFWKFLFRLKFLKISSLENQQKISILSIKCAAFILNQLNAIHFFFFLPNSLHVCILLYLISTAIISLNYLFSFNSIRSLFLLLLCISQFSFLFSMQKTKIDAVCSHTLAVHYVLLREGVFEQVSHLMS